MDKAVVGRAREVVLLPDGWMYSLDAVIDDGRTVNIGDVVVATRSTDALLSRLNSIVRKCDAPALRNENRDWNIGCRRVSKRESDVAVAPD